MATKQGNKLLMVVGTAWMVDALDVALLSFIMPFLKLEWHLSETELGLMAAMTSLGMIFGAVIAGRLADIYGRKPVLIGTLLVFSISNLALAVAPNLVWFMGIRFVTGIGLGGELPVAATLIADHYQGTKRAQMLVLSDSFWAYGWILASLIAYLVIPGFGWRIAATIVAAFALYGLVLRRHLPEEVRPQQAQHHGIAELLSPVNGYRKRLVALSSMWFIVVLTYYGIFLWLPSVLTLRGFSIVNSLGYTLAMSVAQLPGYYLATYLLKHVSAKRVLTGYLIGTVLAAVSFAFADNTAWVLASGALLSFFDLGAWGTLIAMTPGQFPQVIRGTATGVTQSIGRIGSTIGPFLVGFLIDAGLGISGVFGVFVGLLIVAILILGFAVHPVEQGGD